MPDVVIIDVESTLIGGDRAELLLDRMQIALEDMHGPLKDIINDLQDQAEAQFASLGVAAGTPWEPLASSTVANKVRSGYPAPGWPLVATGELRESAAGHGPYGYGETADMSATFGLNMDRDGWNIAALQQFGVPWEHVTQHRHHKDGTTYEVGYMWHLPSRPMLVSSEALEEKGADRIVAHVFAPMGF